MQENIQRYDQLKENKRIEMLQLEKSLSAAKSQEGEEIMKQEAFKRQVTVKRVVKLIWRLWYFT